MLGKVKYFAVLNLLRLLFVEEGALDMRLGKRERVVLFFGWLGLEYY